MKRGLILTLSFFLSCLSVFSYELILPREKTSAVTTNYALFVGHTNRYENMVINDESVYVAPNGAFAHTVKLKEGSNRVVVRSNYNTQVYKFYKTKPTKPQEIQVEDIPVQKMTVKCDNTPLRSTPVDAGLNRIAHLFCGTNLLVNGVKGDFYRVVLSKDKTAWIQKKYVELNCGKDIPLAEFVNMDSKKFKNASIQSIEFTQKLPYTVEERENEILFRVYNPEVSDNSYYTINIPKPHKYTYNVYLQDGKYTFKVNEIPEELAECTFVIDAGHGGSEKGAIGCLGEEEKNINLKIAEELAERLKLMGANVVMTRECDANISLNERVAIAKNNDATFFISIHLNSVGDIPLNVHKNKGTSVYYFNNNSKKFAETLEKSIPKAAGTRRDGVRTASFAVIRPTDYVGVLVETAYMINPYDSMLYNSEDFASNVATGVVSGIVEYLSK